MTRFLFYTLMVAALITAAWLFAGEMAHADCTTYYKSGDILYVQPGIPVDVFIDEPEDVHAFYNQPAVGHELPVARKDLKESNAHFCGESTDTEIPDDVDVD